MIQRNDILQYPYLTTSKIPNSISRSSVNAVVRLCEYEVSRLGDQLACIEFITRGVEYGFGGDTNTSKILSYGADDDVISNINDTVNLIGSLHALNVWVVGVSQETGYMREVVMITHLEDWSHTPDGHKWTGIVHAGKYGEYTPDEIMDGWDISDRILYNTLKGRMTVLEALVGPNGSLLYAEDTFMHHLMHPNEVDCDSELDVKVLYTYTPSVPERTVHKIVKNIRDEYITVRSEYEKMHERLTFECAERNNDHTSLLNDARAALEHWKREIAEYVDNAYIVVPEDLKSALAYLKDRHGNVIR